MIAGKNLRRIVSQATRAAAAIQKKPELTRFLLGLLLLITLLYGLRVVGATKPTDCLACSSSRSDFDDYYQAAARLRFGKDPYYMDLLRRFRAHGFNPRDTRDPKKLRSLMRFRSIGSYLYPPFTAFALQPLTFLSYSYAAALYQLLSLSSLVAFLFLMRRVMGRGPVASSYIAVATFLCLACFCMENFANGNVAFFLILLCGAGLVFAWSSSFTVELFGGLLIGIAAAVKITPLFLGLVVFARRRWAAVAGVALGVILALILPAMTAGWERNLILLKDWKSLVLDSFQAVGFVRPWANNQTIAAGIGKLFIPFSDPAQGRFGLPLLNDSGISDLNKRIFLAGFVRVANLLLYLAAAMTAIIAAYRGNRRAGEYPADVFAVRMTFLVVLISLIGAGVSWYHAYSLLYIPLFARLYQHFALGKKLTKAERVAIACLGLFGFGLFLLPSGARALLSVYSVFAWVCLTAVMALLNCLLGELLSSPGEALPAERGGSDKG